MAPATNCAGADRSLLRVFLGKVREIPTLAWFLGGKRLGAYSAVVLSFRRGDFAKAPSFGTILGLLEGAAIRTGEREQWASMQ